MIGRLFWLVLGAVLGVAGYRRLTAFARSVSPAGRARALGRFTADVREGMQLYMERQPGDRPSTLEGQPGRRELPGPARAGDRAADRRAAARVAAHLNTRYRPPRPPTTRPLTTLKDGN